MRAVRKLLLILAGLFALFYSVSTVFAQTPATVTGVLVEYPECDENESCSFVQASCMWNAVADAASYTYTITEVDTSTQIQTATVASTTLKVAFPITQERTYKCDVFATNAGGQSGGTGTHSLLCSAEGLIDTPTVTTAPTAGATSTPLPTKPPIESPGGVLNTAIILGGVTLVILAGLTLILL